MSRSHRDEPSVLVVDDEPALRRSMEVTLTTQGYRVHVAANGEQAVEAAARLHPDLVILDLGLPGISGHEVIETLRSWTNVPILVLSARHGDVDKIRSLDAGADDYVTKPFSMDELLARVRSTIRRSRLAADTVESPVVETPDFTVDLETHRVMRDGVELHLTPREWGLVEMLVRHAGRLVTQRDLLQKVWGPEYGDESNYLRVFMAQIRSKLEPTPSQPRYFHTETGMGYRFEDRSA